MKPAFRLVAVAASVATVLGVRAWRENERGKDVWNSATDSLDQMTDEPRQQDGQHN